MTPIIRPVRYQIHLVPDLKHFQFKGQADIRLQADQPVVSVKLNLLELAIWRCRLEQPDGWSDCAFEIQPEKESLVIHLPWALEGTIHVRVEYEGQINDQMAGFYRSRFTQEGRTSYIAVTQFQESSARRAFPCMDHPLHKAVFELSLTIPDHLVALANTLPSDETPLGDGRKRITFAPTPKMSTYLVFFGVGAFEMVQDQQDDRVRVVHLPGLADTTDLARDFGRNALQYCEQYYDIPYPLPKMDLIAVPDFAFGAMENWGAITFRENLLLHFSKLTSKAGIQRICEVIAHEIAHQWFGNLVTPADWKYLWLNESFATYFGYGVVAHYYPDWGVWDQFLHDETATAMARDGLRDTSAIEIPGGEHLAINVSTAPIIYNKGASILRMIEGHIGTDLYQKGVRSYLDRHRYDCAESRDLWQAFERVSDQPITAMMQNWIGQPGHPLITVKRRYNTLNLHQKRFTYLEMPADQHWLIPLSLIIWQSGGRVEIRSELLEKPQMDIELPENTLAYKINVGQTGFYRVYYEDKENVRKLGELVASQKMPAVDRWGIQNDLYALVRKGTLPVGDYLDFIENYAKERQYLPLISVSEHLLQAGNLSTGSQKDQISALGLGLAEPVLSDIGYEPAEDELQTTALLRDRLLWMATIWGSEKAAAFGADQFSRLLAGQMVHPDIAKAVMQTGAWLQGHKALPSLRERLDQSPSEHERMNILAALGSFQEWDLLEQALAFTLEHVPPRNRFIPVVAAAANPTARSRLWDWYLLHLDQLENFHPLLYERVITAIWPAAGLGRQETVEDFARNYVVKHPRLKDAINLALENLEINGRFMEEA